MCIRRSLSIPCCDVEGVGTAFAKDARVCLVGEALMRGFKGLEWVAVRPRILLPLPLDEADVYILDISCFDGVF